jgi:hypothetical protein
MTTVGRNAPCPCGSGKKYKQCCLRREREQEARQHHRSQAPELVLEWMVEHHGEAVKRTVEGDFFGLLGEEELDRLGEFADATKDMVDVNAFEWLLAEAELEIDGRLRTVAQLVLGPGGPLLDSVHRQYLEQLFVRPLGLYEVEQTRPGEGLWLRDTLQREDPPRVWVEERTASQTLRPGAIFGARLIPGEPWTLSGCVYPFKRADYLPLRQRLLNVLDECEDADDQRDTISTEIIAAWLDILAAPPQPLPQLVHAADGDPLVMVTDHYRVLDWERLEAALAAQPDLEGSRESGWTRFEVFEGSPSEARRLLLSLTPQAGDRLEAYALTLKRADAGRRWLEKLAKGALAHQIREQKDPLSARSPLHNGPTPPRRRPPVDPEEATSMMQSVYEHTYRNWADEPIPALSGRTPRAAIRDPRSRQTVIELLRTYEFGERDQAETEGRPPASFDFLWQALGLPRDEGAGD